MSKLTVSLELDRIGIERLPVAESVKVWFRKLVDRLEENYKLQRDYVQGATASETPNWFIREANAADVTAGEARVAGNLIIEHKTNGTKREFEAA